MAHLLIITLLLLSTPIKPTAALTSPSQALRLKIIASSPPATPLPGVHDALSAKIFAQSGAAALFLSGFGVSACRLGAPDAGILTLSEMEDTTRAVVAAIAGSSVPVIVDGDTGYGGAANIRRTVRGLSSAGAAAVTIEDQVFPKRCTYAAGSDVRVVSRPESLERINIALAARDEARSVDGNDILVIARTDCRASEGLEEAIARCREFEAAGADIVYAENLQSREEYARLRASLRPETPMILAQLQLDPGSEDDGQDLLTVKEVGELGFGLALFGITALQATVGALRATADKFLDPEMGGLVGHDGELPLSSFSEVKRVVGFPELDEFEATNGI